jgi:hypothetical protein
VAGFVHSFWVGSSVRPLQSPRSIAAGARSAVAAGCAGWPPSRALRATSSCSKARATKVGQPQRNARFRAHCADLRISLPERAHVRALSTHVRSGCRNMCDVRCRTCREDPLPGRGALQRVGLLLDRLRIAQDQAKGQRVLFDREVGGQAGREVLDRLKAEVRVEGTHPFDAAQRRISRSVDDRGTHRFPPPGHGQELPARAAGTVEGPLRRRDGR